MNQPTPGHDSSSVTEAATRKLRTATAPGGWFDQRRRELTGAIDHWDTAERWVRVLAYTVALAVVVLVLGTAGGILLQAAAALIGAVHLPEHIPGAGDGLAATITRPVHTYLAHHTAGLPLTEATAYGTWKTAGLLIGLLSGVTQAAMARLAWTAWSAATLAMVWQATPEGGRTIAVGLAAAALAAASLLALRGISFSLRPLVINRTEVQPQIVLPAPESKPASVKLTALPNPSAPSGPFDHRR